MGRKFLSTSAVILLVTGCKATGGQRPSGDGAEVEAAGAKDPEPAPVVEKAPEDDKAPADATADGGESGSASAAEPAAAGTLVDASTLCAELVDPNGEGIGISTCEFLAGGKELSPGVRFDLLRVVFDDQINELDQVYAVLRSGEDFHDELVAESSEVPGESVAGTVGKIEFSAGRVKIASQEKVTTIGNTGDPDADPEETVDVAKFTTTCVAEDFTCERQSIDE